MTFGPVHRPLRGRATPQLPGRFFDGTRRDLGRANNPPVVIGLTRL